MSAPRVALCFVLPLAPLLIRAQDRPAAAPAAPPAQNPMQKWIEDTDALWQAVFKHEVTEGFDAEVAKLKVQYLTTLESALSKSSAAGQLEDAIALRDVKDHFVKSDALPTPGDAEPASPAKEIWAAARAQFTRLKSDRSARAKALFAQYDRVLAQTQTQLTQRERLDDALLVKAKREVIALAWVPRDPSEAPVHATATPASAPPPPAMPHPAPPASGRQFAKSIGNTKWLWSATPNTQSSNTILTIRSGGTVSWSDRPLFQVPYKILSKVSLQVKDGTWTFSDDLQSFTVTVQGSDAVSRWGTRINTQ